MSPLVAEALLALAWLAAALAIICLYFGLAVALVVWVGTRRRFGADSRCVPPASRSSASLNVADGSRQPASGHDSEYRS